MYKGVIMHRTQIYFEEELFSELKKQANQLGLSISAYIRDTLKKDLQKRQQEPKKVDFSEFAGMWKDRDISIEKIREKAWK